MQKRLAVEVRGIVQGVGFRPFVYRLAGRLDLTGFVRNDTDGVYIEIEGDPGKTDLFIRNLQNELPPLAQITSLHSSELSLKSDAEFRIIPSVREKQAETLISPDISVCPECLAEMLDPADRRFHYPFINCTNCGPRFTIIDELPYDRPNTTMSVFRMCPDCRGEYEDPDNRRFHAQPNACPVCGPQITATGTDHFTEKAGALQDAVNFLKQGRIVAVKGLGGFHLAVDASSDRAVAELRRRKHRFEKPLALMTASLEVARKIADVNEAEERLLSAIQRPIVLCRKKSEAKISPCVSPDNDDFGLMLPYTPLHVLLFELGAPEVLVMTSANISEEPICHLNDLCREQMAGIADLFLMHNRDIRVRCDDSVMRSHRGEAFYIRRSRGFAPRPVILMETGTHVLATGGHLKNTVALTRNNFAFLSQHIGDLENLETFNVFRETIDYLQRLLEIRPEKIIHDLHPEYLSTKWARDQRDLPVTGIQHHYAHILSVMAEHGIREDIIGLALDGTGYGPDGLIWGGELLLAGIHDYRRFASLTPVPLPGGEQAILQPWRMGLAYIYKCMEGDTGPAIDLFPGYRSGIPVLVQMMEKSVNSPDTTSCGRLFDAVSAILQLKAEANYEGQAAIVLEALAWKGFSDQRYDIPVRFDIFQKDGQWWIDTNPVIRYIVSEHRHGAEASTLAFYFHRALASVYCDLIRIAREETGIGKVALSGGCFQNMLLLTLITRQLDSDGFSVLTNRQVPVNDGGISLGQAFWGMHN
jgi:hydrogenase maturation protein HypF